MAENGISRNVTGYLRGLAMLIVLASHYSEWMYVGSAFPGLRHCISTWGPVGVDIFFMLSGYGLYKSYRAGGKIDGIFILKRVLAVYVPYLLLGLLLKIWHRDAFYRELSGLVDFFTAGDYWFLNVMFVVYIIFIFCFALLKRAALPVVILLLAAYSIALHLHGHQDFWTLSNHAFALGTVLAAAEERFKKFFTRRNEVIVILTGLTGAVISFLLMQKLGGSGIRESYMAELMMNIFITVAISGAMYLLPDIRLAPLAVIGEASLFIYILHTTMFYAIIFKLEKLGYAPGTAITAVITMAVAVLLFRAYSVFSKSVLERAVKK